MSQESLESLWNVQRGNGVVFSISSVEGVWIFFETTQFKTIVGLKKGQSCKPKSKREHKVADVDKPSGISSSG